MNGPWPHGDPRAVIHTILSDPRYTGSTAPAAAGPSLLERIFAWIGDALKPLLKAIGMALGTHNALNSVLGIAVLVAAAAGLAYLAWRVFRLPGRRYGERRAAVIAFDARESSADLIALARAAARAERWHDAASALVRAALYALDERGRLRFDPSRTAGEARRILRDPAFDAFEREATTALFADGAATPERYGRLDAAYAAAFGESA